MGGFRAPEPVLGYPTKSAAILALKAQEPTLPSRAIAERVGTTSASVDAILYAARKKAKKAAASALPPALEPTPYEQARTMLIAAFGATAKALELSTAELYALLEPQPPLETLHDEAAAGGSETSASPWSETNPPPPMHYPPGSPRSELPAPGPHPAASAATLSPTGGEEPSREDDEAELAALAESEGDDEEPADGELGPNGWTGPETDLKPLAEPPAAPAPVPAAAIEAPKPAAPPPLRYYLKNANGEYLHENEQAMTRKKDRAWHGTLKNIERLVHNFPYRKNLIKEQLS